MNILSHKIGDLLACKEDIIVHQCNCISRQVAGLAYHIFNKFPYANDHLTRPKPSIPGTIALYGDGFTERYVINMFAQYYPGAHDDSSLEDSNVKREEYFEICLNKIINTLSSYEEIKSIAFPAYIGCGLAGGNWANYQHMLYLFAMKAYRLNKVETSIYYLPQVVESGDPFNF